MENSYQRYGKNYYENNKEYYRNYYKIYDENLIRNAVYLLMSEDKVMYVGQTSKLYRRINNHMNCNSNLRLTKKAYEELNLHWEYAFLDTIQNREELLYIESYLIDKFGQKFELLNEYEPYKNQFKKMDELRKVELEEIADNLEFKVYDI